MKYPHLPKLAGALFGILVLTLAACGGGGDGGGSFSPTDPGAGAQLSLTGATIQAGDRQYQGGGGGTFQHDHGGGQANATRFRATLERNGVPATGGDVQVRFDTPMGPGMMGGGTGTFRLYDDGTHGDPTPGDGHYHFVDHEGEFGFHHQGAHHGEYHYDFFGLHPDGTETNHMIIDVQVQE